MNHSDAIVEAFYISEPVLDTWEEALDGALGAMEGIGSILRRVRTHVEWSQAQLAEHLAVPVGTISAIEARKRLPDLDTARLLVDWIRAVAPVQAPPPFPASVAPTVATPDFGALAAD